MQPIRVVRADPEVARIEVHPARVDNDAEDTVLFGSWPACKGKWEWTFGAEIEDGIFSAYLTMKHSAPRLPYIPQYIRMEVATHVWEPPRRGPLFREWKKDRIERIGVIALKCRFRLSLLKEAGFLRGGAVRLNIHFGRGCEHDGAMLARIWGCPDFSDLTVASGGKEWKVHRSILAASSPVLKSLLCARMSESISGRLEISDSPRTIIDTVLRFCYTGDVAAPAWQDDELPEGPWCDPFLNDRRLSASSTDMVFTCKQVEEPENISTVVRQANGNLMWHREVGLYGYWDLEFVAGVPESDLDSNSFCAEHPVDAPTARPSLSGHARDGSGCRPVRARSGVRGLALGHRRHEFFEPRRAATTRAHPSE